MILPKAGGMAVAIPLAALLATSQMLVSQAKVMVQTEINHNTDIAIADTGKNTDDQRFYRITVNPRTSQAYLVIRTFAEFTELKNEVNEKVQGDESFRELSFPSPPLISSLTEEQYAARPEQLKKWLMGLLDVLLHNKGPMLDLKNFLDPVSGDLSRESGIMLPRDSDRFCYKTHFFGVQVQRGSGKGYTIYRRFNHFAELNKNLGYTKFPFAPFPVDTGLWYWGFHAEQEARRRELQRWLQEVFLSENPAWDVITAKFLDPVAAKATFMQCIADTVGGYTTMSDLTNFDGTADITYGSDRRDEL